MSQFFASSNSRKSLREINLEKQQQREQEEKLYPGLASKLIKSPLRNRESRMLGSKGDSPYSNEKGSPYETPQKFTNKFQS